MASSPKKIKSDSPPKALTTPGVLVLQECIWTLPEFTKQFPNVYATAKLSCEERFFLIKDQNQSYGFPRGWGFASIKPYLVSAADLPNDLNDNRRICLSISGFHRIRRINDGKVSLSIGLVERGTMREFLLKSSSIYKQNTNGNGTANCEFKYNLQLLALWNLKEKYFPDGQLQVRFQVVMDDPWPQQLGKVPKAIQNLTDDLMKLFESGDRSDFTIKCGNSEFKVHEIILVTRSPVFKAMLSHGMVEQEKREVTVTDVEPDILKILLEFIYSSNVPTKALGFRKMCELTQAADKYQLDELKSACFSRITKDLSLDNIGEIAVLVHRHSPTEEIRKHVYDFCAENFDCIRKIPDLQEPMKECFDEFFKN